MVDGLLPTAGINYYRSDNFLPLARINHHNGDDFLISVRMNYHDSDGFPLLEEINYHNIDRLLLLDIPYVSSRVPQSSHKVNLQRISLEILRYQIGGTGNALDYKTRADSEQLNQ